MSRKLQGAMLGLATLGFSSPRLRCTRNSFNHFQHFRHAGRYASGCTRARRSNRRNQFLRYLLLPFGSSVAGQLSWSHDNHDTDGQLLPLHLRGDD